MLIDPITLGFYAIVCAVLGAYAPKLGSTPVRFVIGAVVGIAAATVLPVLRGMF